MAYLPQSINFAQSELKLKSLFVEGGEEKKRRKKIKSKIQTKTHVPFKLNILAQTQNKKNLDIPHTQIQCQLQSLAHVFFVCFFVLIKFLHKVFFFFKKIFFRKII
jgi:hypothetical protein